MFGHNKVKPVKRTKPQPKHTPAPKKTATRQKVAPKKKKVAAKPQKRVVARKIVAPRKIPTAKKKPTRTAKTEMRLVGKRSGQSISVTKRMPKGWRVDDGATTNPRGTKWVTNGESHFNGKRKSKLLITDEKLFKENINKPNSRYELKRIKTTATTNKPKAVGNVFWANSQKIDATDQKPRRQYVVARDNGKTVGVAKIRGYNNNPKNKERLMPLDRKKYKSLTKESGVDKRVYTKRADTKKPLSLKDRQVFDKKPAFKLSSHDTHEAIKHTRKK